MLSFALFAAIILVLDFFLIHHLFGPFGVIISNVMVDLGTFIVVLMLFLLGFMFQIACLFTPVTKDANTLPSSENASSTASPVGFNNGTVFGALMTSSAPLMMAIANATGVLSEKRNKTATESQSGTMPKCRPRGDTGDFQQGGEVKQRRKREADRPVKRDEQGKVIGKEPETFALLDNRNYDALIILFEIMYFGMFAMIQPENFPRVKNGPDWSNPLFQMSAILKNRTNLVN